MPARIVCMTWGRCGSTDARGCSVVFAPVVQRSLLQDSFSPARCSPHYLLRASCTLIHLLLHLPLLSTVHGFASVLLPIETRAARTEAPSALSSSSKSTLRTSLPTRTPLLPLQLL